MIPKIIHYCWFGGNPLPSDLKKYIATWKKYCPDYEIIEWNESNFDVNCHPFVAAAYENKAWAFVSDYARLKVVYDHGGIYLDTDIEIVRDPGFLLNNECFIGVEQQKGLCTTGLGFGAEKNHPVIGRMMEKYDNAVFDNENKEALACPILNMPVFRELGYVYSDDVVKLPQVTIYPCRYFDPLPPGDSRDLLCDDTVFIHHYAATWTPAKNRLKRLIIRTIGEKTIHKIKSKLKYR